MFRFRKWAGLEDDGAPSAAGSPRDGDDVLQERVGRLEGDEYEIYKWLREFYSERWIAETLLLDMRATKEKIRCVCTKLGVRNKKALLRTYGRLERPQKGPVNTEEIDDYIDTRTEKAIQGNLDTPLEGGNENG